MYDGALGVLLATEILETLCEQQIPCRHPIRLVSFVAEEPNPFNLSTLGSKVLSGRLNSAALCSCTSLDGTRKLSDVIGSLGGHLPDCDRIPDRFGSMCAFLECHVEQSRHLFDRNLSLASVKTITGIYRENLKIIGEANHSGTTKMEDRHDALVAAAELILEFDQLIREFSSDKLVGTIGYLHIEPNSANIIPCEVDLLLEIRSCEPELRKQAICAVDELLQKLLKKRQITLQRTLNLDQKEIALDAAVQSYINRGIAAIGEPITELNSMAGHDAANVQRFAPAGMLFVRSMDGKSHCFDEFTLPEDIEKAGNALLQTVLLMDKELDT